MNQNRIPVEGDDVLDPAHPLPGATDNERIRAALNAFVRDAIWPASLGMTGLYLVFAISHPFLLPPWSLPIMVSLALGTAVTFLLMGLIAKRRLLPLHWVHPYVCAGISLSLINCLVHMYLLRDPYQSINTALVLMGAGIFLLSWRWLLILIALSLTGWLAVVIALSTSGLSSQWPYFGYVLLIAAVLSGVAHAGRVRAFERIARLRLADQHRQDRLEAALLAVRQSEERLQQAHADLAQQVKDQTIELEQANHELIHEVTERRRAEADTQFLARASASIAGSLDYDATLTSIVEQAVPYLADYCFIILIDSDQPEWCAVAHMDPQKIDLVRELCTYQPDDPHQSFGIGNVVRRGTPEVVPRVPLDEWITSTTLDPNVRRLIQVLQPYGYMTLPLIIGKRLIGTIVFVSSESKRVYEQQHLRLASEFAYRAAHAVEHARLYQQANHAIQARDAFVSIAAHELKSPLTALSGYAQLLYDRASKSPSADAFQHRALQTVLTQSKRLDHLIGTMLDVSRIDNDQLALNMGPVSIPKLVTLVVENMRLILDVHVIMLDIDVTQPLIVEGDAVRLEQVFQNLLQNAVKYSPNGGTITVRVEREDDDVVVAVTDTGIGIALEDIPRLFQRFFRAHSAERSNIKGLGIGLYVVSEIVQRHGGTIGVQSVEWRGSTFTVRLPLAQSDDGSPALTTDHRLPTTDR